MARIAEEQAALRRVATIVAKGAPPEDVVAFVTAEVGRLLDVGQVNLVRYDSDGAATTVGAWAKDGAAPFAVGAPLRLGGQNVTTQVFQTGRAARIDDSGAASGMIGEVAWRQRGVRSAVGVPIAVEGRLWGCIVASSARGEPLPADTEERLSGFTELVATALAEAQARTRLRDFAREQAALRRVATLVAQGAASTETFSSVAAEIGQLLGADVAVVIRFEPDRTGTVVGRWSIPDMDFPDRGPLRVSGVGPAARVLETGRPAHMETFDGPEGSVAHTFAQLGVKSGVGAPITVEGRLWGVVVAATTRPTVLTPGSEQRLANFGELTATAIANAQARTELRGSADEQAALRNVATLVARAAQPEEVFAGVAAEIGRLLGADLTTVARYDSGEEVSVLGAWSGSGTGVPFDINTRAPLGGMNIATVLLERRLPVRIDDYRKATGAAADVGRALGIRAAVAAPITVAGEVWGFLSAVSTRGDLLPPDAEGRLTRFAQLVATSIANAEARSELRGFAEEQATLRQVATLVASGAPPEAVFAAVTEEARRLLDARLTYLIRYDGDGQATLVGVAGDTTDGMPVGSRAQLGGRNVTTVVFETGRPARLDDNDEACGQVAELGRGWDIRSGVGVPVHVAGRLWGAVAAISRKDPFPVGTEDRLAAFTGLISTALANAQAHLALRTFAEEQAALRRVATLVARGMAPEEVCAAVTAEVGGVLGCDYAVMSRYDPDGVATTVGAWARPGTDVPVPVGRRLSLGERNVHTLVAATHRPARMDAYGSDAGAPPAAALAAGMHSAVGTPIDVEGRLWGVMIAASRGDPLPTDTETRLVGFTELVATAVANAEAQAQLTASRARTVATADATRRQIERNLHDGVQQHLISLRMRTRIAQTVLPAGAEEASALLDEVADGLTGAVLELRELTRGLHPAALAGGGLRPALKALARRSTVPVRLDLAIEGRLVEQTELAAYYTVAEALTNAAKHASASVVDVCARADQGVLRLEVRDDGRGGATVGSGSGLVGLTDRIEALGGRLTVQSPAGEGTTVHVVLPLGLR